MKLFSVAVLISTQTVTVVFLQQNDILCGSMCDIYFFITCYFLHPYISVHPCCTSALVQQIPVHTHRYNHELYNGPQHSTAQHCYGLLYRCNVTFQLIAV